MSQKYNRKTIKHKSAGGVVICGHKNTIKVALIQKNNGEWVVPKGHIYHGEDPREAAIREVVEELNFKDNLYFIGEIGITKYSFLSKRGLTKHLKQVYMYAFATESEAPLLPLKKEGYVKAQWLNIDKAIKLAAHPTNREKIKRARNLFLREKRLKNLLLKDVIKIFKKGLKNNLFAIILAGTYNSLEYISHWSDVDILLVVEINNLRTKQKIAKITKALEKKYKRRFGLNVIEKNESLNPLMPFVTLDGKTLQALLELKKFPERLLFCRNNLINFYYPRKGEVKKYSLLNIALLLLLNRRNIIKNIPNTIENYKGAVAKSIHISFIITKLALQYFTRPCFVKTREVLSGAKSIFPDFNFETLQNNISIINKWSYVKNKSVLIKILNDNDNFIEQFSDYVFKKTPKKSLYN